MRKLGSALILAAAVLAFAAPAEGTFPGKNGKIAAAVYQYVGHGAGFPDVYSMNPDGSVLTRLTGDNQSYVPAWSPDGTKIAFTRNLYRAPFGTEIRVMNADGTGVISLTDPGGSDRDPAWSPDGERIAFSSNRSGNGDIYLMNADGSVVEQLTSGDAGDSRPAWSPNGDEIAFSRYSPGASASSLYVIKVDGTGERFVTGNGQNPNWSPDGTKIAFDDQHDGWAWHEVWIVNADGTGGLKVTDTAVPTDPYVCCGEWNMNPAWSPDGSKIVFEHSGCTWGACFPPYLETVNPDGSERSLLNGYQEGGEPDWQRIPGPQRGDYRNAAQFCKALREFLGDDAFRNRFAGGANAHGKCVSANH